MFVDLLSITEYNVFTFAEEGMGMKLTRALEHEITGSAGPQLLTREDFSPPELADYLGELLRRQGVPVRDIIQRCNLERSYGYQLFNGTRRPTRDILMVLALELGLSVEEARRLFEIAGRPPLYARRRRDAAVLYGLSHNLSPTDVHELLLELGEEGLKL